eukprot:3808818-Rhodomonas_salina.3
MVEAGKNDDGQGSETSSQYRKTDSEQVWDRILRTCTAAAARQQRVGVAGRWALIRWLMRGQVRVPAVPHAAGLERQVATAEKEGAG